MKKILVLSMALMMVAGFTFARNPNANRGPSEQGNQNQRATENVPDHAQADLPFEIELESVVYEGICNEFGSHEGETLSLVFLNDVHIDGEDQTDAETYVHFEEASSLGHNSNYVNYTAEDNVLTITVVEGGTFGNPRPEVGDFVTGLDGIVDGIGNPVVVPEEGVEVEQSTSVTVSTEDELRDALACENIETIILADGIKIDLEDELVINRSVHLKAESEHSATISLHEGE